MNEQTDEEILTNQVSDNALEAAGAATGDTYWVHYCLAWSSQPPGKLGQFRLRRFYNCRQWAAKTENSIVSMS